MTRQRRRGPYPDAPNLIKATPAIVLLVSTHAAGLARADDADAPSMDAEDADASGTGSSVHAAPARSRAPGTAESAGTDRLVVPLDLDEASDSAFVRRLLLSHGIEFDLGENGVLGPAAFVALVARMRADGAAALIDSDGAGIDVELVPDEAFDPALASDVDAALSHVARDLVGGPDGWQRRRFGLAGVTLRVRAAEVAGRGTATADPGDCPVSQDLIDAFAATLDGSSATRADEALHARLHEALSASLAGIAPAPLVDGVSETWRERRLGCPIVPPVPGSGGSGNGGLGDGPAPDVVGDEAGDGGAEGTDDTPIEREDEGEIAIGPPIRVPSIDLGRPDDPPSGARGRDEASGGPADAGGRPRFSVSDDLPPGFESLAGPVDRIVDLFFNDRKLGATPISLNADEFEFVAVDEVVAMLEGIDDAATLVPVLAAPMRTNAARLCLVRGDPPGCGTVETDSVAALYDESALRLDLFVAPALQPAVGADPLYLDAPARRPGAIVSLGTVAADVDGQRTLDANGGLLVGYGATHLSARADYTSRGDRARLRELRATRFVGDYRFDVGSFGFFPGTGLLGSDLLGASIATSWDRRIDRERAFATDVVVYLPRRGVVQLVVDDRIYHGESYSAGNRSIDTSALPDGTYELEIRTLGEGGGVRSETRLFTKGTSLPPPGQTVVSLTAGAPLFFGGDAADDVGPVGGGAAEALGDDRFLPVAGDVVVLGASAARRFGDNDAWRVGVLGVGEVAVGQLEYTRLGARYTLQAGASVGTRDVLAAGVQASLFVRDWSATFSHSSARADDSLFDDPTFERFFPRDGERTRLSLTRSFGATQVGGRFARHRGGGPSPEGPDPVTGPDDDPEIEDEYSLFARHRLFRNRHASGVLEADWRRGDLGTRTGLQLRVFFGGEDLRGSAHAGLRRLDGGAAGGTAGVEVGTGTREWGDVRWETGTRASIDAAERRVGIGAGLEHPWFAADASTDWHLGGDGGDASRASVASARAQIGIDGRGAAIGGIDRASSGVIVDVDGTPRGGRFDIMVEGADVATGTVGRPQFIALEPFSSYRVRLVPHGVLTNGIGETEHEFTLFPGSVRRIDVQARREVLLIATLMDERGGPILDATFETRRGPVLIDSSGVFQAELPPGETFRVRRDGAAVCEFVAPSPESDDEDVLIPARPIACRSLAESR